MTVYDNSTMPALAEAQRRLDEVEAIAHIGSWTWDGVTDRVEFSDEQYRLYGLEPQSRHVDLGTFLALLHPDDRAAMLGAVRECSRTGEPFMVEHRIVRPDGSLRWLEGRGRAFMRGGRPERMVGTCHDVTGRKLLAESLRETLAEVRSSRARIVEAADAERRRVERDLHDGAQQRLLAVTMGLRLAQALVDATEQPELTAALEAARAEVRGALEELRDLARGIHPGVLAKQGLRVALESVLLRSPLPVALRECPQRRLPESVETAVYFLVCEALANAVKHASATRAAVSVRVDGRQLTVDISDDGRGGARIGAGSGLCGLADRMAALDGRLTVDSDPRTGTVVSAELPCG